MTRIGISFKESETDLLEYLRGKRSPSNYIKDLIQADKDKNTQKDINPHKEKEENEEDGEFSW